MAIRIRRRAVISPRVMLCDEVWQLIVAYVPRARTLQQLACVNHVLHAHVYALPHAHFTRLQECVRYARCTPAAHMSIPRTLRMLVARKCELCDQGRVIGVKSPWHVFAHDKCIQPSLFNVFHLRKLLQYDRGALQRVCDKLVTARVPFKLQRTGWFPPWPDITAMVWLRTSALLPRHWTVQGIASMTLDECAAAAATYPALNNTDDEWHQLYQILETLQQEH